MPRPDAQQERLDHRITRGGSPARSRSETLVRLALFFCLALIGGFGSVGCSDRPSVVIYVSADEAFARPILAEFERTRGVRVDAVFDTEATKTTGLANRLRAERDRPRADVFWSSENVQTILLADEGVLVPARSERLDAWPAEHRDAEARWYAFAARARVIVIARDRVPKEEWPTTWMELTQDRWAGRVAMADPRFGTTRTHMGVLATEWERRLMPGAFGAWLEGLGEQRVALLTSGNAGVVEAVASGQFDIGMTDTDDVWAAQARGMAVDLIYPRHVKEEPSGGTLLIPNTCALVARPANDAADRSHAIALMEYLLSAEVERALLKSDSRNIPLAPSLAEEARDWLPPDPLRVDWPRAAAAADEASGRAASVLRAALERKPPAGRVAPPPDEGSESESDSDPAADQAESSR
jgi:iron(III) transport system substrate-binding protein